MRRIASAVVVVFWVLFPASASAHVLQYGTVSTELDAQGSRISLQTELSQNVNTYGLLPQEAIAHFQEYFRKRLQIRNKGSQCEFTLTHYDPSFENPHSRFEGFYTCPDTVERLQDLSIQSDLFNDAFYSFDHFLVLTIGNDRYEFPFSDKRLHYPGEVIPRHLGTTLDYFFTVAAHFLWMGMVHIWTGYDHILFLLSVLLLARSLKKILLLVTSFTVAHSLTLVLAGLHIVTLSSHIVEPAIAATIAFVAVRNIQGLKKAAINGTERIPLAFAFGLVHGLGFASALSETTIPQIFFVPALLTFNVGIELGQLCILALALPLLRFIDATPYRYRILTTFSYAVAVFAGMLILVRVFF